MPFDVCLRTEQPFFLAAPACDADRAAWLYADGLENTRGLHHRRAADCVVGRSGRRVPRIQVPAEHNDLVLFVRTHDLTDNVITGNPIRHDMAAEVKLQLDRRLVGEQPEDSSKVFVTHHDRWHDLRDVERPVVKGTHGPAIKLRFVDPHESIVVE